MSGKGPDALPQAFFLPADTGHRFCLYHAPAGATARSRILFLHPFAEEMHAARRVVAQQCRTLAADGHAVLQIDLLGCGDSSGDFGDATWSAWVQDALRGLQWLREHAPPAPTWLWGLRAGALLACETARALKTELPHAEVNLLLWQPVASGQQQLQQFLRLHAAAQWLGRDAVGEPPAQLLAAGLHAHVAGYSLSPTLATELKNAQLTLPPGHGRVTVIECSAGAPAVSSPWLNPSRAAWEAAGWQVSLEAIGATSFWQSVVDSSLSEQVDNATRQMLT